MQAGGGHTSHGQSPRSHTRHELQTWGCSRCGQPSPWALPSHKGSLVLPLFLSPTVHTALAAQLPLFLAMQAICSAPCHTCSTTLLSSPPLSSPLLASDPPAVQAAWLMPCSHSSSAPLPAMHPAQATWVGTICAAQAPQPPPAAPPHP